MSANDRRSTRARRRGIETLVRLGGELRAARLALGISQLRVAEAVGLSRSRITRIEGASVEDLTVTELHDIAAVLGLDPVVKLYPGGSPLRDGPSARKLAAFLSHARRPLTYRLEVPLPAVEGRLEQRAWDSVIAGGGERTAAELEMRLHDAQAQARRIELKRRDDPMDHFLLLLADTRTNRRVLREHPDLFPDLPRLRPSTVLAALEAGRHPGSGLVLI